MECSRPVCWESSLCVGHGACGGESSEGYSSPRCEVSVFCWGSAPGRCICRMRGQIAGAAGARPPEAVRPFLLIDAKTLLLRKSPVYIFPLCSLCGAAVSDPRGAYRGRSGPPASSSKLCVLCFFLLLSGEANHRVSFSHAPSLPPDIPVLNGMSESPRVQVEAWMSTGFSPRSLTPSPPS